MSTPIRVLLELGQAPGLSLSLNTTFAELVLTAAGAILVLLSSNGCGLWRRERRLKPPYDEASTASYYYGHEQQQ